MTRRPLTQGEIDLCKSVFGDSIRYDDVTVSDGKYMPLQPRGTAMAPNGHLYMHGCYHDDYSLQSVLHQGHFIHEMTHVWQFQQKILHPVTEGITLSIKHRFNYNAAYPYKLDEAKDLTDYNMEQQATIIQDYFVLVRSGNPFWFGQCKNDCGNDERRDLFEKVLDKFLKNPCYAKRAKFPGMRKPKR